MSKLQKDYRTWLIKERPTVLDAEQLSTYDLEKRFEAIGCLRPQSTHTECNKFLSAMRQEKGYGI